MKSFLIFVFARMYDVDGNGVIDQDEMTKIIQVSTSLSEP